MKAILFTGLLLASAATSVQAGEWDKFLGYWQGTLLKNIKDSSAGGNAAQGDLKTKTDMMFLGTKNGIAGFGRVGADNIEVWVLEGDQFNWTEGKIRVESVRLKSLDTLPEWVAQELKDSAGKPLVYKISSCKRVVDQQNCVEGKDVPKGMTTSAIFTLYFDAQNRLRFGAFYSYDKEQKQQRILTWFGEEKET